MALRILALAVFALHAGCVGKTVPEHVGTTTLGTCECCGQLVDIGPGQACSSSICAAACNPDASNEASDDSG